MRKARALRQLRVIVVTVLTLSNSSELSAQSDLRPPGDQIVLDLAGTDRHAVFEVYVPSSNTYLCEFTFQFPTSQDRPSRVLFTGNGSYIYMKDEEDGPRFISPTAPEFKDRDARWRAGELRLVHPRPGTMIPVTFTTFHHDTGSRTREIIETSSTSGYSAAGTHRDIWFRRMLPGHYTIEIEVMEPIETPPGMITWIGFRRWAPK